MPPDVEPFDLDDCLTRVRRGDQEASRRLVEQMYPLVARVVHAYLRSSPAEDDCRQEVFLRMFVRLDQYRSQAPFEHWLARVAVNVCLDYLRKQKRRPELRWTDLSERESALLTGRLAAPDPAADGLAARELVEKLLASLPAEDRMVVQMLDVEKQSVQAIAKAMGRSESWVKVRAFRARKRLQTNLDRLSEGSK